MIDRTALLRMLLDEYTPLMRAAGMDLDGSATGAGRSLDRVQRVEDRFTAIGTELPVTTQEELARFYLLDRIVKRLGANMNVGVSGDAFSRRQVYENARMLRDDVAVAVTPIIAAVDSGFKTQDVTIVTPFLTGGSYDATREFG